MKERIKTAFSQVVMDDACVKNIEQAIQDKSRREKKARRDRIRFAYAAAAVFLLVMVFALGNQDVVQALDAVMRREVLVSEYYTHYTETDRTYYRSISVCPPWLREEGGRLYFVANDEHIDLTDMISTDQPFTYVFTDYNYVVNSFAVGISDADADTVLDAIGYYFWIRYEDEDTSGGDVWIGSTGRGRWDSHADENFGWYEAAVELLEIPDDQR